MILVIIAVVATLVVAIPVTMICTKSYVTKVAESTV